jgi:site-specific DNA recombinase
MARVRCAIYTRKSSEEGLEQDFNSLDAQYGVCSAYIVSQASEGWSLAKTRYDDGGISGGTLDRPGLQRLLADIAAGKVDTVVVYKVDRLTRSLLDFARLVEVFDKAGVSFVSITQSFNTTTSMGRLTLNMLLSFAQFEREVTAERIRDKIAASKARGMWMGGTPPLGFAPDGRTLKSVEDHAELIQCIFNRYLVLGNVRLLAAAFEREGIKVPVRTANTGRIFGGGSFMRGQLYTILNNPIYIGKIRHKSAQGEKLYDGNHPAIIDPDLWERVQTRLTEGTRGTSDPKAASPQISLLAGKLFDEAGAPLVATHACKKNIRYRYYVSRSLQHGGDASAFRGLRIPAREIEPLVINCAAQALGDPLALLGQMGCVLPTGHDTLATIAAATDLASQLKASDPARVQASLADLVTRIAVRPDQLHIMLNHSTLASLFNLTAEDQSIAVTLSIPVKLKRAGLAMKMILPSGKAAAQQAPDSVLIKTLSKAQRWWMQLVANPNLSVSDLAKAERVTRSYITRIIRLAFLDPQIVQMIFKGNTPATLDTKSLTQSAKLPMLWVDQRIMLGLA